MAHIHSITHNNIDLPSLKNSEVFESESEGQNQSFWQRLGELFWSYTNEAGKSDTKSYEGLL